MIRQRPNLISVWFIFLLSLVLYISPWVLTPGVGLSMGAYDLAEFLAKRPFARYDENYLLIMALRGQLTIITLMLVLNIRRPLFTGSWWLFTIVGTCLVIAQLPPLTFITTPDDINQQMQALLALISLGGVGLALTGILWRVRNVLWLLLAIVGIVTGTFAIINASRILADFTPSASMGLGSPGLIILYGSLGLWYLWRLFGPKANRATGR